MPLVVLFRGLLKVDLSSLLAERTLREALRVSTDMEASMGGKPQGQLSQGKVRAQALTDGVGTPDPNTGNLVNWCF